MQDHLCYKINQGDESLESYLSIIASVHHEFICIHPFFDGNGRIGRAIIDQLCLSFGLPMVMGGYPRNNAEQRSAYHKAIRQASCGDNHELLKKWIKDKILQNLLDL